MSSRVFLVQLTLYGLVTSLDLGIPWFGKLIVEGLSGKGEECFNSPKVKTVFSLVSKA